MTNTDRARQHVQHAEITAAQYNYEIPTDDGSGYRFIVTYLAAEIVNLENDIEVLRANLSAERAKVLPPYDPDAFMDADEPGETYCDACGLSDSCTCLDAEPDIHLPTSEDNPHTNPPVLAPSSAVHPLPISHSGFKCSGRGCRPPAEATRTPPTATA
tara:strand:- start:696 stop:1169 length:474 start_codon:yes stop_codon:yes gene_type:complete